MARPSKRREPLPKNVPCDWLIFDISNVLHTTFHANHNEDELTVAGFAVHVALTSLNKYFSHFKPMSGVVMAFDRHSWRKDYTASEACVSKKPYKGQRRKDMTPSQQAKYMQFIQHVKDFEELMTNHTGILTLAADGLEADDLIAGFCQAYNDVDRVIISSDSDMLQLKRYGNVRIFSPITDKEQTLDDFDNDPDYYVFQKCIRGDAADNIQNAFPRVRTARIRAAYEDPYEHTRLMKETWTDQDGNEMSVEDLYNENKLLIDLEQQPEEIRLAIMTNLFERLECERRFSMFHFMKFCGRFELKRITENIDIYIKMLSF